MLSWDMQTHSAHNRKSATQNQKDKLLTHYRLRDFDPDQCPAKILLTELFGENINGIDLASLAETCAFCLDLYLDREARRRKSVLWKWFDENMAVIDPFLRNRVVIETRKKDLIGAETPVQAMQSIRTTDARSGASEW
jgi:hypothetical protein